MLAVPKITHCLALWLFLLPEYVSITLLALLICSKDPIPDVLHTPYE